jgi:acetyltransferase
VNSPSTDYPGHLARERRLADGRRVLIRPVRPDDAGPVVKLPGPVDYDRHMAFVAEAPGQELVGEARYLANADGRSCEFSVGLAEAWRHTGLAQILMEALIGVAQARGFATMEGLVLAANTGMLDFVRTFGFEATAAPEDPKLVRVVRKL